MPYDLTGIVDVSRDNRQTAERSRTVKASRKDYYSYHSPDYIRQQDRKRVLIRVTDSHYGLTKTYLTRRGNVGDYHLAFLYSKVEVLLSE